MKTNIVLGADVEIGQNVILEGDITIGSRTIIDHNCVIRGSVSIGNDNWIYPNCVIGAGPQHKNFVDVHPARGSVENRGGVRIGNDNIIREFTNIHQPTNHTTSIGSHCYIMVSTHIAHDVVIGNHATIAMGVMCGGHVSIRDRAFVGMGVNIHQNCTVGEYAMVGMNGTLTKSVPPFALMNRQKFTKINRIGMKRNGMTEAEIAGVEATYRRGLPILNPRKWYEKMIMMFCKESVKPYYLPNFGGNDSPSFPPTAPPSDTPHTAVPGQTRGSNEL